MMPIAWTKTYQGSGGQTGRVFTTTMGAATDLQSEGLRRLLVNAAYWCVGLEDEDSRPGQRRSRRPLQAVAVQLLRQVQGGRQTGGSRDRLARTIGERHRRDGRGNRVPGTHYWIIDGVTCEPHVGHADGQRQHHDSANEAGALTGANRMAGVPLPEILIAEIG